MWGQMKDSGDCCGFVITRENVELRKVAGHGSCELNKDKLRKKEIVRHIFPSLCIYLLQERSLHVVALRKPDSEENNLEMKAK